MMPFEDRQDAGRRLAQRLDGFANRSDVTVLGIPRGGVPIAFEIASALHLPMDIFLSRKLGVPGHEELACGAVAIGGGRYLDDRLIKALEISSEQIEKLTAEVTETLTRRSALYRGKRPALEITGRTLILVDDGIATGASTYAAILALRQWKPARLVLAVPVAPPTTCRWLETVVDEVVCLLQPEHFNAVGQFYRRFAEVTDDEVIALLRQAALLPGGAGNGATHWMGR